MNKKREGKEKRIEIVSTTNGPRGTLTTNIIIPRIVVTDYDSGLSHEIECGVKQKEPSSGSEPSSIKQETSSGSEPSSIKQEASSGSETSKIKHIEESSESKRKTSQESEEEDREIIESLTKAHSKASEKCVNIDVANAPTESASNESAMKIKHPLTMITDTDDDIDLEVSHLTSLIELRKAFLPLSGPVKFIPTLQNLKATISNVKPPGMLPNISEVKVPTPRRVPIRTVTNSDDRTLNDFAENRRFFDPHSFQYSDESSSDIEILGHGSPDIMTKGNIGASSFGLSVNVASYQNQCKYPLSKPDGSNQADSQYSSSSSYDINEEPGSSQSWDEQPPKYWKLYASNSPDKSAGSSKDELNEIMQTFYVVDPVTDENAASTSEGLGQSSCDSPKKSRYSSKK
jgi:hypothetical protein